MTWSPAHSEHGISATYGDDYDIDDDLLSLTQRMRPDTISTACAPRLFRSMVAVTVTPNELSPSSLPSNYPHAYLQENLKLH